MSVLADAALFDVVPLPSRPKCSICETDASVEVRLIGVGFHSRYACGRFPSHREWVMKDMLRHYGFRAPEAAS